MEKFNKISPQLQLIVISVVAIVGLILYVVFDDSTKYLLATLVILIFWANYCRKHNGKFTCFYLLIDLNVIEKNYKSLEISIIGVDVVFKSWMLTKTICRISPHMTLSKLKETISSEYELKTVSEFNGYVIDAKLETYSEAAEYTKLVQQQIKRLISINSDNSLEEVEK